MITQNKYLPIRYCPITFELELIDTPSDAVFVGVDPDGTDPFTTANTTTSWAIQNVQVKVDMCTLDNALDNSYAQRLLSGKACLSIITLG